MIKIVCPFAAGLCFVGYAWLLHVQAGLSGLQVKLWIALGILLIVKGICRSILYHKNIQLHLKWRLKTAVYTTVVLFVGIFLSVGAWLLGNTYNVSVANLDYLIVTWGDLNWEYPQSTQCRSYVKALSYLKENSKTMLVIPGVMEDGNQVQANEQVMQYLLNGGIERERIRVVPGTPTLKQSIKVSLEQIESYQGSQDRTNRQTFRIGLLTDGIYTKNYEDYASQLDTTLLSLPASLSLWYLPQLAVDEIRDYMIYHVEESF